MTSDEGPNFKSGGKVFAFKDVTSVEKDMRRHEKVM